MVDRQIITLAVNQGTGAGGMAKSTLLRGLEQIFILCNRKRGAEKKKINKIGIKPSLPVTCSPVIAVLISLFLRVY
jgi:hypothetical protein